MNKKLHVGASPLTNQIFAGTVLKDGVTWGANKCDVTRSACRSVVEFVLANKDVVVVTYNGKPKYEIRVIEL